MRNRDYKNIAEGSIVHIYNRGNNKERIFFDEQDYKAFLFRLGLALGFNDKDLNRENTLLMPHSRIRINGNKNCFKLHSFCLMPNHFHLLIEQCGKIELSKLISQLCTSYSMYINKKYKRVGHLFQERFKSNLIENNEQLMWISSYIHMNPIKDGFVKSPEKYKWSSYLDFTEERTLPIVTKDLIIELFGNKESFEKETVNYSPKADMSRTVLDM